MSDLVRATRDANAALAEHRLRQASELEAEVARLRTALEQVSGTATRQYLDWMHFHERAMTDPFKAEFDAQGFARQIVQLVDEALRKGTAS